ELTDLLLALVRAESPTDVPGAQREAQAILTGALEEVGLAVRYIPGDTTGGHLLARPDHRPSSRPIQLIVGHCDTVWPLGTLAERPARVVGGRLYGPGAYDMKAGLAQAVLALRTLRELGLDPPVTPVVFVNSDEEVGSTESRRWVVRLARLASRALILEPSLGMSGKIKTARKGVGRFDVVVTGKAAHAGLDPGAGASAILELSHVIQRVHELNDPEGGTTVNVGVVDGGIRPNVIAPRSRAQVDVRVLTREAGEQVTEALRALEPRTPGVSISVEGGMAIPPLERTPRNRRLWRTVRRVGREVGLDLEEATAGGGSDGNTTSRFTATVDGLGPVGDGAHALHEHVEVDGMVRRCALLARLLLAPGDPEP
ncbi:MAG TPA: M20 family metallopeptidase, partial [Longimicrobiales bacterium]|nr:M20 family metallopeptidase [Longimicrobiales bacterium]